MRTILPGCPVALRGLQTVPLPKGEAADINTVAHINYLLGELPQWVMAGWLDPKQARNLTDKYERRRDEILAGGRVQPAWSPAQSPPVPSGMMPPPLPPINTVQPAPTPAPLAAFREDHSLAYWLLTGALLMMAGVLASVIWAWEYASGRPLVFTLLLGLTGGLAALARSRVVREERITAMVLTALAALLVPLDLFAANAFLLPGGRLTTEGMGCSLRWSALPLYMWLARRRNSRTFLVLSALDGSAALHFLLQAVLPPILHIHSPLRVYGAYGPVYVLLAALYLWASGRDGQADRRAVWLGLMHITAALAVGVALATGALTTWGLAAGTLLLAGALYAGGVRPAGPGGAGDARRDTGRIGRGPGPGGGTHSPRVGLVSLRGDPAGHRLRPARAGGAADRRHGAGLCAGGVLPRGAGRHRPSRAGRRRARAVPGLRIHQR